MNEIGVQREGLDRCGRPSGGYGAGGPEQEPEPARRASPRRPVRPSPVPPGAGGIQLFSMFQKNGTGETSTPDSSFRHATGWNHCP